MFRIVYGGLDLWNIPTAGASDHHLWHDTASSNPSYTINFITYLVNIISHKKNVIIYREDKDG